MKPTKRLRAIKALAVLALGLAFSPNLFATEKLFIPSHPLPHAPLFVALHGCLSTADDSEKTTRMSEFAEARGFYVFYPEPERDPNSKGCFEFYTEDSQRPGGGDAAIIIDKVKNLVASYDIDEEKIYVLGMSGGASLISVLLSCYPTVFKGGAIHSGMGYGLVSNWQESLMVAQAGPNPMRPRNTTCSPSEYQGKIFLIQGSRDQVMNPRHYFSLKSDYLAKTEMKWKMVKQSGNRYPYVHQFFYENKQLRGQGVFVIGMNHEWSGSGPVSVGGPKGPDVSQMIVSYFLDQ